MPDCSRKITKCDGFCVGRDLVAILQGKTLPYPPREICAWCRELLFTNPKRIFDALDAQDAQFAMTTQAAPS